MKVRARWVGSQFTNSRLGEPTSERSGTVSGRGHENFSIAVVYVHRAGGVHGQAGSSIL